MTRSPPDGGGGGGGGGGEAAATRRCRRARRDCSRSSTRRACRQPRRPGCRPTRRGRRSHRSPGRAGLASPRAPEGLAVPAVRPGPGTRSDLLGLHRPSHPVGLRDRAALRDRRDQQGREIRQGLRAPRDRPARGRSRSRLSHPNDSATRCRRRAGSHPPSGRQRSGPACRFLPRRRPQWPPGWSPRRARCQACVRARILLSSLTRTVVARRRRPGQTSERDRRPQSRTALRRCGCIDSNSSRVRG